MELIVEPSVNSQITGVGEPFAQLRWDSRTETSFHLKISRMQILDGSPHLDASGIGLAKVVGCHG